MFYNCHIHIFEECDVPRKFLPLGLVRLLSTKVGFRVIAKMLNNLNPLSDKDFFDRYVRFVEIGKLGSQKKIFEECRRYYPSDVKFIVLPMDMAFMKAGNVPREYAQQLEKLKEVKDQYDQILPFVHLDPRREGFYDLFIKSIEEYGFKGVKLYPPLGYFPYDPRLIPVYEYCSAHKLPILTHCSPYNSVRYRGRKKEIKELLKGSKIPIDFKKNKKKELTSNFTNPKNWEFVLNDFPQLKICLGHFGSEYYWKEYIENPGNPDNWFVIIRKMIEQYDNLYSDISFTLHNQEFFPLLKVLLTNPSLRKKILFGSDYYMVATKSDERRFGVELRAFIGEDNFKAIALDNPQAYLSSV